MNIMWGHNIISVVRAIAITFRPSSSIYCNDRIYVSEEWLVTLVNRVTSEVTERHLSVGVWTVKNHYARTVQRITEPWRYPEVIILLIYLKNQPKPKYPPNPVWNMMNYHSNTSALIMMSFAARNVLSSLIAHVQRRCP
jgi:hypothetical protein